MDTSTLRELCNAHGFSLEMHSIPATSKYFAILVPTSGEVSDLAQKKTELDQLQRKLVELCPAIEYVTIQCGSD